MTSHDHDDNTVSGPLGALGRNWARVGRDIRRSALRAVDTGLQATADAMDRDRPVDLRESGAAGDVVGRWTDAAGAWVDAGLEIGRSAVDSTAEGLRRSAETIEDELEERRGR